MLAIRRSGLTLPRVLLLPILALLVAIVVPSHALVAAAPISVITIHVGGNPESIAVDPRQQRVYVIGAANGAAVINTHTNAVIATIPVPAVIGFTSVAVNPSMNRLYVPDYEAHGTVAVIDTTTNRVVTTIAVGSYPDSIAVKPYAKQGYVTNFVDSTVSVLDLTTNTVVATLPKAFGHASLAVVRGQPRAYIGNYSDRTVSVLNTQTNTIVTTIPLGDQPFAMAVDPFANRAYVVDAGRSLLVIDLTTNTVIKTLQVGSEPLGVALNVARHRAYVMLGPDVKTTKQPK